MSFADLGLSDKVVKAAETAGYTSPTPIQEQAIPHVIARRDVLGIAQTGTGKTAAFTLPMLTLLENGRARARMPRTLILEPTRELAAQVEENFIKYGSQHKLSVALLIGGVSFDDQDTKITRGVDVLIATPGRLLDHFERGKLLLTAVELFVIDEADRMLDMGFIPDIERIAKLVPFTRQTLFFSATMPPEVQRLADTFLHNPVRVEVARASSTANTITQRLVSCGKEPHQKRATLRDLIRDAKDLKNAIIFCNRKRDVATLYRSLVRHGFSVEALHGDMDQRARMQALDNFRNGSAALLVASDVAARGLDIPDVSHVFNYDVPFHAEDYVHRIGRTGRAGRLGAAFSLVARGDEKCLEAIESLIKQSIEWHGKPLAERTDEDDSYSAPDRGVGWRRDDADRRDNHKRKHRDKGRDRGHGRDDRRGHFGEENARPHHPPHQANRNNDEYADRNRHRDDYRQRRMRYDNEPDIPVMGFGDHIPAFMARALPRISEDVIVEVPSERRHITPTSLPPRDVEETKTTEVIADIPSEETSSAVKKAPAKRKTRRKAGRKSQTGAASPAIQIPQPDEPADHSIVQSAESQVSTTHSSAATEISDAEQNESDKIQEKVKKSPARKRATKKVSSDEEANSADASIEVAEEAEATPSSPKRKASAKTGTRKKSAVKKPRALSDQNESGNAL